MDKGVQGASSDVLDYLTQLQLRNTRPNDAVAQLRPLQLRHPALQLQLVWEEEPFDSSVHYDVLITAGKATISIGLCVDTGLPWPLRGMRRWTDADVVRVNGRTVKFQDAISCLELMWTEVPIAQRLVNACLLDAELERCPVELSDVEIQEAMDAFRRAHALLTVSDTQRWMDERGMTHLQLERLVSDSASIRQLRARLTDADVADYYDAHEADYALACVLRVDVAEEITARRIHEHSVLSENNLYAAVMRALGPDEEVTIRSIRLRRCDLSVELAELVFAAAIGTLVGPVPTLEGYSLLHVSSHTRPELNAATRSQIRTHLFEDWLRKRRAESTIEWYWGTPLSLG